MTAESWADLAIFQRNMFASEQIHPHRCPKDSYQTETILEDWNMCIGEVLVACARIASGCLPCIFNVGNILEVETMTAESWADLAIFQRLRLLRSRCSPIDVQRLYQTETILEDWNMCIGEVLVARARIASDVCLVFQCRQHSGSRNDDSWILSRWRNFSEITFASEQMQPHRCPKDSYQLKRFWKTETCVLRGLSCAC